MKCKAILKNFHFNASPGLWKKDVLEIQEDQSRKKSHDSSQEKAKSTFFDSFKITFSTLSTFKTLLLRPSHQDLSTSIIFSLQLSNWDSNSSRLSDSRLSYPIPSAIPLFSFQSLFHSDSSNSPSSHFCSFTSKIICPQNL